MTEDAWIENLFAEKSLWDAYKSAGHFPRKAFDIRLRWTVWLVSPIVILLTFSFALNLGQQVSAISAIASVFASFSATVIGFLVTGLAIFASLSERKIWIELAKTPQKDTKVSSFKYIFFNLLRVFVIFIFSFCFSIFAYGAGAVGLEIPDLEYCNYIISTATIVNTIAFSLLTFAFVEAISSLKSFIWNLYTTFVAMIAISTLLDNSE